MLTLSTVCMGCARDRTLIIPANREVSFLLATKPFIPPSDGYFVPEAQMLIFLNEHSQLQMLLKRTHDAP